MSVSARVGKLERAQGDGTPVIAVTFSDGTPFDTRSAEILAEAERRGEPVQTIQLSWEDE